MKVRPEISRNLGFLSAAEQSRLQNSTVAIAGAGGDGGMLAIQLARLGVGNIRLADPEPFEAENINRQARATSATIGENKAEVIGEYIREINPSAQVDVYPEGILDENVTEFVRGANLLVDETEFTIHTLGVLLARTARDAGVPNLMAMNLGFGTTVTTFQPHGKTLEDMLGLDPDADFADICASEVPLDRWLAYIPPYADMDMFKSVALGEQSAPSIAPGVNIASAVGATQGLLNLVHDMGNKRPKPVYFPKVMMMDAMTGESRIIGHPRLASKIYMAKLGINNLLGQAPKASYSKRMKYPQSERSAVVNPKHQSLLEDTLRAPSAHNTQSWLIAPTGDGTTYELYYDQKETLPEDPDDKDAYLTMGAFVETMALQAPNHGLNVEFDPAFTRHNRDLFIGSVAISDSIDGTAAVDPLSIWVAERLTNRNRYQKNPLPAALERDLQALGNVLIDPKSLKDVIEDASIKLWSNPRFVQDLKEWFRENNDAEDGITPEPFNLSKTDIVGLKFAFWRGQFKSKIMSQAFSAKEIGLFTSSPRAAVITVPEMEPQAIFDAGRRLLRSWVRIVGDGYSYQPFSVAVDDREAAIRVAEIAGVNETPVALYRIGKADKPAKGRSNRKPLSKVLI